MQAEEIAENETDTNNDEEESGSNFNHIDKSQRKVYIEKETYSIFESHRRYRRGEIDLQPDYQRKDVWTFKKKSRLIESVLLNIPIPVFYLAELENEKKEVVDGQQRLNSFFHFLENGYPLEKLDILDLNGNTFKQLPEDLQRKLEDYQLSFFIIKKESHKDIRFDVFQRVNEGATKLSAQELRNGVYRGYRIELLKELAGDENFKKMVEKKLAVSRMKDHEAVLRFIAFHINGYETYSGNLNSFLNDTLDNLPAAKNKEFYDDLKTTFRSTMKTIFLVFGAEAFIKGDTQRKKINLSLFDILCYSFAQYDKEKILNVKKAIRERFDELFEKEDDFYNAISSNTLTKNSVKTRFEIWLKAMEDCLNKG
ncbi:MAG: DUF262 domain-containing protein [Acidobacteria bacterium]|jgi:hypothetical protein|nr:DUF262 domain-containing protein [Acidobacteriota bacterium]